MKTLIYYKSRHGTTRQYAEMLHERIDSDIYATGDLLPPDLDIYDRIVLAGPFYIGKLKGANALAALWRRVQDKQVILVTVSAAAEDDPEIPGWLKESLPADMLASTEHIHLLGQMRRSYIPVFGPLLKVLTKNDPLLSGVEELEPKALEPVIKALEFDTV